LRLAVTDHRAGFSVAYELVPLPVESFGRLDKPVMGLGNALANAGRPEAG
jgi:hypothetical protein